MTMTIQAVLDEPAFIPLMGYNSTIHPLTGTYEFRSKGGQLNTHSCTRNYRLSPSTGPELVIGVSGPNMKGLVTLMVATLTDARVLSIIGVARMVGDEIIHRNDLRQLPECMGEAYLMIAADISLPQ